MRMENAKDKMSMKERGWKMRMTKNKNDNIGTRGNKFKMLLNILGCEIGSREFKDRNSFYVSLLSAEKFSLEDLSVTTKSAQISRAVWEER